MAKYIQKQAAIYALVNEANTHNNPVKRAYTRAAAIIEQITSEDVQPAKRGRWEEIEEYGGWGDTYFRCSICGDEWDLDTGTPVENGMKYCPNCGARMDGDAK